MSELDACLLARFAGTRPPDWLCRWLDDGLGGVLLFADNITDPAQLRALAADLRAHNPEVLIAADEEGGIITRVEARTGSSYPGNSALGAVGDTGLTRRVAASIGAMLAAGGVNLDLAPTADVDSNPANPVIGVRSFGADPGQVAAHTAAFVEGIQSNLVAACAKHFPGHGRSDADSHVALPVVGDSLRELSEADLVPFRAAIEAGVRSVMTAHVVFPAVDQVPATISRRFLAGLLRGELGFGGVIITDALGMTAIGDSEASAEGAVRSLAAGADLLCLPVGCADRTWRRQAAGAGRPRRAPPALAAGTGRPRPGPAPGHRGGRHRHRARQGTRQRQLPGHPGSGAGQPDGGRRCAAQPGRPAWPRPRGRPGRWDWRWPPARAPAARGAAMMTGSATATEAIDSAVGAGVVPGAVLAEGLGGHRGLGWGLRHDMWDNMGDGWPASGAGHTGFTGTSLSIDPRSGLWAVLLTNSVHFGRGPEHSVVGLRKQVHATVAAELLGPRR
jgi:beta-glucosidase-like glycosyl hydrolase